MIARLLIGLTNDRLEKIEKILNEAQLKNPHPDLLYFSSDSKLGIAEARKIKEHFSLKPYSAKGRVIVLEDGSNLTPEAQNALLKILEELPEQGLFILGADSDAKFLPTILSRCQIERLQFTVDSKQKESKEDIEKLIESSIEQRFEYIEKLKNKEEFFLSLVNYFHQNLASHLEGVNVNFLKELLQAEEWQKQNVAIRPILEYLMLVIPKNL